MVFATFDLMWALVTGPASYRHIYNEKYNDDELGFQTNYNSWLTKC